MRFAFRPTDRVRCHAEFAPADRQSHRGDAARRVEADRGADPGRGAAADGGDREEPQGRAAAVARIEERTIAGPGGPIRLRLYWPEAAGRLPAIAYYHGG